MQPHTDQALPDASAFAGMGYASQPGTDRVQFASPGVPNNRKIATGLFLGVLALVTIGIALDQGASVLISTIIGAVFILGFIGYLRILAPPPFCISLDGDALRREEQGMERSEIAWPNVVKVKEERFPNGLPISLAIYKRVGDKGLHRAYIVYRDDLPGFEDFLVALKQRVPPDTRWNTETVHE